MRLQSLVLGSATLTVILIGVGMLIFVMFLPIIAILCLPPMTKNHMAPPVAAGVEALHLYLLWTSTLYLSLFRRLIFPIRKKIMFIVFQIARIEAIREETPTLYLDLSTVNRTGDDASNDILQSFKSSVRRRYKQVETIFRQHNIRCESVRSEEALNLQHVVPIMLEHERRCCEDDGKNLVEEFVKRFLVVTMTTDAVLDLYYDENNVLCCVQLSVVQGQSLHWFMYFCLTSTCRCGIWYHGVLNAMLRGLEIPSVQYVNAQIHQTVSKQRAGLVACEHTDDNRMHELFPFGFTKEIPAAALQTSLWVSGKFESRCSFPCFCLHFEYCSHKLSLHTKQKQRRATRSLQRQSKVKARMVLLLLFLFLLLYCRLCRCVCGGTRFTDALDWPRRVYWIKPSLIEINEKNNVIAEAT